MIQHFTPIQNRHATLFLFIAKKKNRDEKKQSGKKILGRAAANNNIADRPL
jgi:hypothetical protein